MQILILIFVLTYLKTNHILYILLDLEIRFLKKVSLEILHIKFYLKIKKILAFGSQGEYGNKTSVFGYLVNILNKITNKLNAVALYEPNSSKKQKISAIMEVSCILK